ncbi:uncharacterized protein LOC131042158 [Cryptomeria japonica]|uniref:uncharacterized protein LOC131042158 n=1 Tax=Cryptomeria japonica TaxID=3369 RepID=UPI0027DA293B|nr:uncharacterized protein LOC131042158 [Cryptomeria japonica]XP_059077638.1 uncharacterized protein LOC131042158 [Cryptomeria japonica]
MEKEARHVQWATLRLTGKPLITGSACGETPLLWVACRASFGLVHIYCDSELKAIWRFPSDLIFIHVEKSRYRWIEKELTGTTDDADVPYLLAVTVDGCVWFMPVCPEHETTERPFKRKKKTRTAESKKMVPRFSKDEWGLFEDVDVYESMVCDASIPVSGDKDGSSNIMILDNPKFSNKATSAKQMSASKSGQLCLQIKQLMVSSSETVIENARPRLVMQEKMIGCVQGACFACFGPQDMVIVVSTCGMEIFQASSTMGMSSTSFKRVKSVNGDNAFSSQPTCGLVVTSTKSVPSGNKGMMVVLHDKLFGAFSDGLSGGKSPHLLLKGDVDGCVYMTPLFFQDIDVPSSRLLCRLGQPILALLAISSGNAATNSESIVNKKSEGVKDRQLSEVRDTLLVVGQHGRIVAVSCSKIFDINSCIISSFRADKKSFEIELDRNSFEICEWKVQAPLTSVCLLGSKYLCYCARSEGFISTLFEDRDTQKSFGMDTHNLSNKDDMHGKHQTGSQSKTGNSEWARCSLREKLFTKKLPVADAVIGVAGKDISESNMSGRPMVILTARGRILGVEICNSVPIPEGYYAGAMPKRSWRTWESDMDANVKSLMSILDDISRAADHIHQFNHLLNHAISELAISLKVAFSILTDPSRDNLLRPKLVNTKYVRSMSLSPKCSIKVTPHSAMLAPSKTLAFNDYHGGSEMNCVENFLQMNNSSLVRFSVTLDNCTIHPLSPHWILVLELQNAGKENSKAIIFSSIINNGFGLQPDSQCIVEFDMKVPGLLDGPVSLSTYLCHLCDYHKLLHNQYSTDVEKTTRRGKHLKGLTCVDDSKIEEFFAKIALEEVQNTSKSISMPSDAFGSVCIPLSQHRIDILSIVSFPPQKFYHSVRASHLSNKSGESSVHDSTEKFCHDNVLGLFSGILSFTFKGGEKHSRTDADTLTTWRELFSEDLLDRGSLSKTKDKIILSIFGGHIISISLKGLRDQHIELHFEAPTLLLGCLLREALIWRLKNCEAIDNFQHGKNNLDSLCMVQDSADKSNADTKLLEAKKQIEVLLDRAEALSTNWNEINLQDARDTKVFPILEDIHSIMNDLLKLYRTFRQS